MKIGFIDYYLDEPHSNDYHKRLPELSGGKVEVCYAYGEIPAPKTGVDSKTWCETHGVVWCATPEEVVEKSEGIIVLAPDHSHKHEELADAALRSGKPVFVDKTFAPDLAAAERMFTLAEEHNTPLCTFSALRFAEEYADIHREGITAVSCWGGGPVDTYTIEWPDLLRMLQRPTTGKVPLTQGDEWYTMLIHFKDGRKGSICGAQKYGKFANLIKWPGRALKLEVVSKFFTQSITAIAEFMLSGKPAFDKRETLWAMAALTAAMEATEKLDSWVEVPQTKF